VLYMCVYVCGVCMCAVCVCGVCVFVVCVVPKEPFPHKNSTKEWLEREADRNDD